MNSSGEVSSKYFGNADPMPIHQVLGSDYLVGSIEADAVKKNELNEPPRNRNCYYKCGNCFAR